MQKEKSFKTTHNLAWPLGACGVHCVLWACHRADTNGLLPVVGVLLQLIITAPSRTVLPIGERLVWMLLHQLLFSFVAKEDAKRASSFFEEISFLSA